MAGSVEAAFEADQEQSATAVAKETLGSLVQKDQLVGDVFSMTYEDALVLVHDWHRKRVGGIPSLSFLLATRVNPDQAIDHTDEEASVLLLRVLDSHKLPQEAESERVRIETAQQVSGDADVHWDDPEAMDAYTANQLSFAGVRCRILGTFYLDKRTPGASDDDLVLRFGGDISNYYPNRGLKVYKPNAEALAAIVNYRDPDRLDIESPHDVEVGEVRYASTNRSFQGVSDVTVDIMPADLLAQKTALFGMTRTGKSNTTKILLKSVFELRNDDSPLRIGQLVFDPNGEYANENVQDVDSGKNASAIKNLGTVEGADPDDVVTYGLRPHPNDPNRRMMLLNFYEDANVQIGKTIIDGVLADDSAKYIQNFVDVAFEEPDPQDRSATVRYRRRLLAYRALLARAGFQQPGNLQPRLQGLFNAQLIQALQTGNGRDPGAYQAAANVLTSQQVSWQQLANALQHLYAFMEDNQSGYNAFESQYVQNSTSGENWADEDFKKLLAMFKYANGARQVGKAKAHHASTTTQDYADEICELLEAGKLVIIDQSSGDPRLNQHAADRIMWRIFRRNQELFTQAQEPPHVLVYIEEAHNLLPKGSEDDFDNVWVRTAKEGAKYNLGMVYATQEVSSIQKNILKNTANWFIGHLNNRDETSELVKYYDFADFEKSIRRAPDKGFLRVKTLSNLFVVPVQIRKFEV